MACMLKLSLNQVKEIRLNKRSLKGIMKGVMAIIQPFYKEEYRGTI